MHYFFIGSFFSFQEFTIFRHFGFSIFVTFSSWNFLFKNHEIFFCEFRDIISYCTLCTVIFSIHQYDLLSWKLIIKLSLREKCPYSEFYWHLFSRIRTEYGPEKLQIQTFFTQCILYTTNPCNATNLFRYSMVFCCPGKSKETSGMK